MLYNEQDLESQAGSVASGQRQKLYKTQMCRHIMATGACAHGVYCHFAHSEEELRPRRDETVLPLGEPRFGGQSPWSFNPAGDPYASPPVYPADVGPLWGGMDLLQQQQQQQQQLQYAQQRYKTRMCKHVQRGSRCPKGNACGFAHSELELRRPQGGLLDTEPRGLPWGAPGGLSLTPAWQPQSMLTPTKNGRRGPRQSMFKTRLCRYANMGAPEQCPRGDGCTFAHSESELRAVPRRHQQRPTDCTARWKGAIFAARKNRAVLEALRDALVKQYRGRRLRAPPTAPPPVMSAVVTDQHEDDDEDAARSMVSAFESGILIDTNFGDDDRPPLSAANEARESTQVRYLCLEIECCYSEELRRRADANAQARRWLSMARYLAAAVDLLQAALQGVEPWHIALVTHAEDVPLPDYHDRRQLAAVLTVLTLVRDHTVHARDDAVTKCENVVDEYGGNPEDPQGRQALAALDVLQQLTLE